MDPISAAIVVGATGVGGHGITDAYDGLRATLKRRFGTETAVVQVVDSFEANQQPTRTRSMKERKA
jgi:hypothetical protein